MKYRLYDPCPNNGCYSTICHVDHRGNLTCTQCGVDRGRMDENGLIHHGSEVHRPVPLRPADTW
jgi:hypothetical protein